jgi:hypothetical protein
MLSSLSKLLKVYFMARVIPAAAGSEYHQQQEQQQQPNEIGEGVGDLDTAPES